MKTFIKKGKRISKDILEELDQVQFSIPALDTQNIHIDGVDVTGNLFLTEIADKLQDDMKKDILTIVLKSLIEPEETDNFSKR